MAEEDEEKTEEEAPKKKSKMMLIIIIVVVLLLGGGGAAFFLMGSGDDEGGEDAEEVEIQYETVELKPFVVNLANNEGYLKVTLLLEYDPTLIKPSGGQGFGGGGAVGGGGSPHSPLSGDLPGVLNDREAMIRDAVLVILSSKSRENLLTPEGKETLKEELVEAINDATGLDEPPVVAIYFIEFVIQ